MDFLTVDRQVSSSSDKKGDESEANEDLEVDNSKSVLLKIATLYAEQLMSDLILEVGGHGYPAHRLILCASSEVFQVMLMNREWSEWRESRIVLQETPTAASVFPHFLKYFYTGQIRISHHTVLPVLSLADKYNVKDLVSLCLSYMSQHIAQAAKRAQLISWMQYTMACGHNDVAKECQNFVKWNLEWVWSDSDLSELEGETLVQLLQQSDLVLHNEMSVYSDLSELEGETLVQLLQQSDLVLHNEMSVYRFVVRWLNKQRERLTASDLTEAEFKVHWESLVAAVFSHVRFVVRWLNKQRERLTASDLTEAEFKVHWESLVAAVFSHVRFVVRWLNKQRERLTASDLTEAEFKVHWESLVAAVFSHVRFVVRWLNKQRERLTASDLTEAEFKVHWESLVAAVFSHVRFVVRWLNKQRERLTASDLTEAEFKVHWESLVAAVFSHVRFVVRWLNKQRERLTASDLTEAEFKVHWESLVAAVFSHVRFVVRWLNKQRERLTASDLTEAEFKVHWESLVAAVFSHVRFPMMCPNQLAKLLLCPLTQEHKDFFMERMAIAMSYQSGQYERVSEVQQTEAGRMLFTPRLYTEDTWGSVLAVDNFHSLPCYHTRTFIFSTRPSIADVAPQDKLTEWTVDLYPKGVWFRKSLLIVWAGTYDVPEVVLRTVRISITCQNCPEYSVNAYGETEQLEPDVRVKIGILVWGVQKGVEHVSSVVERVHRFSPQNRVLNIDGALDFDELNTPLYSPAPGSSAYTRELSPQPQPAGNKYTPCNSSIPSKCCSKCSETCDVPEPRHLLGPNKDQLRIQVVIVPLTDYCHVGAGDTAQG
ncbi:hypothetical protein PYW07_016363 [Mythimna separata]|uniref:BTB domain-containing protein n=1 Tax=Mythimna separata TaxID=271217 RepID=A0AAD7YKH2_MYTSE|nr:hypothetical protein PYW07_016363 [Mythimna separata]